MRKISLYHHQKAHSRLKNEYKAHTQQFSIRQCNTQSTEPGINFLYSSQVSIVVNFDLPVDVSGKADCETYLHRIGRTGRFGKKGLAINLVDGPNSMTVMKDIEEHFGRPILRLDTEDFEEIEKIQS
eukprot:TRINITY_DN1666_c0_g1_i2.p1 TRINITY_DN1666_c0_g1~~TRINITY_DN1666_c0_g1_i2.p1  ORF type:complete len:127 (+),score=36.86 TRINITY_DN1666_c0_g1_i2:279-659(+)